MEMEEKALVQGVCVSAYTSEPSRNSGLSKAEDPLCGGRVEPFGQRREHHGDLLGRGFQPVQGRVAPSSERGAASLTAKGLDPFGLAMLAIANQSMHSRVSVAKVRALPVRTGEALGVHPLRCSPPAFHLTPGAYWR